MDPVDFMDMGLFSCVPAKCRAGLCVSGERQHPFITLGGMLAKDRGAFEDTRASVLPRRSALTVTTRPRCRGHPALSFAG